MVNALIISVSPEARQKLIFYFIAEQVPQKLSQEDRNSYTSEKYRSAYKDSIVSASQELCGWLEHWLPLSLGESQKAKFDSTNPHKSLLVFWSVA